MSGDLNHDESIFKSSGLIGYLVKRLNEDYPDKQVGKTVIQKMVYLLSRKNIAKFDFSMYHYGPYSSELSGELSFAEKNGIVKVTWRDNEGYFIKPTNDADKFLALLKEDERQAIDEIAKNFGKFKAIDLSLIATALYLRDNFGVEDSKLAEAVHNAKKRYSPDYIAEVLKSGKILPN
jgi:uncharacterized protein YwgA